MHLVTIIIVLCSWLHPCLNQFGYEVAYGNPSTYKTRNLISTDDKWTLGMDRKTLTEIMVHPATRTIRPYLQFESPYNQAYDDKNAFIWRLTKAPFLITANVWDPWPTFQWSYRSSTKKTGIQSTSSRKKTWPTYFPTKRQEIGKSFIRYLTFLTTSVPSTTIQPITTPSTTPFKLLRTSTIATKQKKYVTKIPNKSDYDEGATIRLMLSVIPDFTDHHKKYYEEKTIAIWSPKIMVIRHRESPSIGAVRQNIVTTTTTTTAINISTENTTDTNNVTTEAPILAKCYECGLDIEGIPRMPGCYFVFESHDARDHGKKRKHRKRCMYGETEEVVNNTYVGPTYVGGCFKRFTDVGVEYSERGCRQWPPTKGKSFASHRYAKLELVLHDVKDGCVFSPHASLTPFSRGISLFVRYHVCVCSQRYCNFQPNLHNAYKIHFSIIYFLIMLWKLN